MHLLDIQTILLPKECFLETKENRRHASEVRAAWILVAVVDCPPFLQVVVVFLHLHCLSSAVYTLVAVVDSPALLQVVAAVDTRVSLVAFLCICAVPHFEAVVGFLRLHFLSLVVYILVAVVDSPSSLRVAVAVGIVATEFVPLVAFHGICVVYLSDLATVYFPVLVMVFPSLHLGPRCVLSALKEDILGRRSGPVYSGGHLKGSLFSPSSI